MHILSNKYVYFIRNKQLNGEKIEIPDDMK